MHTAQDRIALLFHGLPSCAFVGDPAFFFSGEDLKERKRRENQKIVRERGRKEWTHIWLRSKLSVLMVFAAALSGLVAWVVTLPFNGLKNLRTT